MARAAAVLPQIEAGQVYLPQPRWPDGQLRPESAWVDDFIETCAAFPHGTHDDDVDALTQLLVRCQRALGVSSSYIIQRQAEELKNSRDDADVLDEVRYRGYKSYRG